MITVIILTVLVIMIMLVYRKSSNAINQIKTSVPGVPKTDAKLGNLPDVEKVGSLHAFCRDLHAKLGPVASFWFGETFIISTADPEAFRQQKGLFNRPHALFEFLKPMTGDGEEWKDHIQFMNGKQGKDVRHALDQAFTHDACMRYLPKFLQVTEEFVEKLKPDQGVLLRKTMLAVSLRSLMETCFGPYFSNEETCANFADSYDILEEKMKNPHHTFDMDYYRAQKRMMSTFSTIAAERRTGKNKAEGHLLIDEIIEIAPTEQWIQSMGLIYVVAGFHTSGTLLTWLLYYLCVNPECQEKVYQEMKEVLGDDDLYPAAIRDLAYTRKATDEALRLSVMAPMAARYSKRDDLRICGHRIPKETPLLQCLGVVHQSGKQWNEPDTYNPDRFNKDNTNDYTCPFFGFAGQRKCPAYRFAYWEVTATLSVLLRKYRVGLSDPEQRVERVFGFVTHPSAEIPVTLTLR